MESKTIGAILIITGTCVGAGILALPLSTAGLGFIPTVISLGITWIISVVTALLLVEVLAKLKIKNINFDTMCSKTLGRVGQVVCMVAYLILMYAVSSAYLSGGTSMLSALLKQGGVTLPYWVSSLVFAIVLGAIVCFGHRSVDLANRTLLSIKGISFIVLVAILMPDVTHANLFDFKHTLPYFWYAVPVLFFAFGFQVIVPSMYNYLEQDIKQLKIAIVVGSLIPFLLYSLWLCVTLGILPRFGHTSYSSFLHTHSSGDVGALFTMLGSQGSLRWSHKVMDVFTNVAVTTSFLTVTMALKDYLSDIFKLDSQTKCGNGKGALLTYLPPLALVLFAPTLFQVALDYAAASLAVVLVFLPVAMAVSIRRQNKLADASGAFKVSGGVPLLTILVIFGIVLLSLSFMASWNMLPVLH
ncbi:hypothetical protein M9194_09355 [Vibrio sp. S4M6]|uniref:amino acid permease n=1 Tax=Vibrio sinus TaxID=2946865 RepID=UPI002029CCC7|nr:aromatic amino acid transport family protein [Vibrio sinus]MCL9781631.1 hypothetical protein [Vibrio sinus]